jgi:hypothetical protein
MKYWVRLRKGREDKWLQLNMDLYRRVMGAAGEGLVLCGVDSMQMHTSGRR